MDSIHPNAGACWSMTVKPIIANINIAIINIAIQSSFIFRILRVYTKVSNHCI